MIFDMNLEIQFLLKQGQVEISMDGFVPDFTDSVLVHRGRIEELNSQIKVSLLHTMPCTRPLTLYCLCLLQCIMCVCCTV